MKLTQKVDHFTVFNSFPSTSGCSQKFPPNNSFKKIDGWTCEVASGMFSLGGWREKVILENCGRALVNPKNQPGGLLNAWNEAQSTVWTFELLKEAATLDIASPDTCQCLKPPIEQLSHHHEFTPAAISLKKVYQSLGWKLIVEWCGYMLVVLVWFCLMCDLDRFP